MTELPTYYLYTGLAFCGLVAVACFWIGIRVGSAKQPRDCKGRFIKR